MDPSRMEVNLKRSLLNGMERSRDSSVSELGRLDGVKDSLLLGPQQLLKTVPALGLLFLLCCCCLVGVAVEMAVLLDMQVDLERGKAGRG